jgi:hypothetical protein
VKRFGVGPGAGQLPEMLPTLATDWPPAGPPPPPGTLDLAKGSAWFDAGMTDVLALVLATAMGI